MRVMISMDTHSLVDGASKAHTLKRYLTDLKDEKTVNTSSLRCRELDCLRAFYYVAILMFLKEHSGEVTPQESNSGERTVGVSEGNPVVNETISENNQTVNGNQVDGTDSAKAKTNIEGNENQNTGVNDDKTETVDSKESNVAQLDNEPAEAGICDTKDSVESSSAGSSKVVEGSKVIGSPETVSKAMANRREHSRPQTLPLNISHLAQLSQGILWDLQAKRFALTETLGYIHKAISQLLLSKNTKPSESTEIPPDDTQDESSVNEPQTSHPSASGHDNVATVDKSKTGSEVGKSETNSASGIDQAEGATASLPQDSSPDQLSKTSHHDHHQMGNDDHICHSMLSHHFDHMLNVHSPHRTEIPDNPLADVDVEVGGDLFDICGSCQSSLHKSRKILWEDEPHFLSRQEGGLKDMTILVNPAKYINVPDEWYNMPVDQKYFKPYVTMAILKDEQEYVMHELKRGPDITQAPFPNPLDSIKNLLDVSKYSSHVQKVDQNEFVQNVISWGLNFAVTTQQKETFLGYLQSHFNT